MLSGFRKNMTMIPEMFLSMKKVDIHALSWEGNFLSGKTSATERKNNFCNWQMLCYQDNNINIISNGNNK